MRKNKIQIFVSEQFGEIRTLVSEQGEVMFAGKDVAVALGYDNPSNAVGVRVDNDDKTIYQIQVSGSNYKTRVTFINESGLYALILSSKLPSAKAFKRWVTSEVLPQIRQTGGYIPTHDADGRRLSDEEIMQLANSIMRRTIEQKNLPADDCLSATEVAKMMGLGDEPKLLNEMLVDRGIIHWAGGRYRMAKKFEDRGLDSVRFFNYYTRTGQHREKPYQVWTPQGVDFVKRVLTEPNFRPFGIEW